MELKTLFVGIVFAVGVFAVKSGIGIHYLLSQKRRRRRKVIFTIAYGATYLFIFLMCAQVISQIDFIRYFEAVQKFLACGMGLHVLMAAGLLIWGILLLKGAGKTSRATRAWLALIVPCPVCITVIFLSLSFLISYFPESVLPAVVAAYGAFMAIALATVAFMFVWQWKSAGTPESSLGSAMVIVAVYFLLSILLLPQFGRVDEVYRLAAYQGDKQIIHADSLWTFLSIISLFLALGFFQKLRKLNMRWKWI